MLLSFSNPFGPTVCGYAYIIDTYIYALYITIQTICRVCVGALIDLRTIISTCGMTVYVYGYEPHTFMQVHDERSVIGKNLFKKETNIQPFVGLRVKLSTGIILWLSIVVYSAVVCMILIVLCRGGWYN